ncbi:MAG: GNAT family N-acyltransferase [Acidobacteriota bacterium]
MSNDPFSLDRPWLERLLGLEACGAAYAAVQPGRDGTFEARVLRALGIDIDCDPAAVAALPPTGPLVIAANHPHGVLDGLVVADLVRQRRPDVRLLANRVLERIPELGDLCFFVDPFGGPTAAARSHAGLRAAYAWLAQGRALVVFPAGEVAYRRGPGGTRVDSPWRSTVGRLVRTSHAAVVPICIDGANSRWFYAAGRVHPALRTALLPRELLAKRGSRVRVHVGRAVAAVDLAADGATAKDITARMQRAVAAARPLPLADAVPDRQIEAEIDALAPDAHLLDEGAYRVFCAPSSAIPRTLREIGRLRELAFRAAGEGTGRETDLDTFDGHYLHLFAWDHRRRAVVGAYRIGRTDHIVASHGLEGLYTRTLFHYDRRLTDRLSPALELGRSFVSPAYQRGYSALLSLWKGIGRFVVRNPQYRVLFGTVSVSARYSDQSQQLLMHFLRQNHRDDALAELVAATQPARLQAPSSALEPVACSLDDVNRLVAAVEPDRKGIPVLLRQYLKLNAKLLGFNIDPHFADALDALMMVDLAAVDRSILTRYLGRDGAAVFLAAHAHPTATVAA